MYLILYPDIIGKESWLNPSIYTSEVFPPTYNVYRKDRSDGYGRVFIACHHKLTSSHLTFDDSNGNELIAARLQLPEKE